MSPVFCASNPGRTVSRYDFVNYSLKHGCNLFNKVPYTFNRDKTGVPLDQKCMKVVDEVGTKNPSYLTGGSKSQSLKCNIISSFKATGICPFNSGAVHLSSDNEFNLAEKTGLAYIPLYSPARHPTADDHIGHSTNRRLHQPHSTPGPANKLGCSRSRMTPLSSEPNLLDRSLFETQYDNPTPSIPLPGATTISKFLALPNPPNQIPTKCGKSAGRVLTSLENLQMLQQKEN